MTMAASPPRDPMKASVAASSSVRQSQRMLPPGVCIKTARWPMASLGAVTMLVRRGSGPYVWKTFLCVARTSPMVVKSWPVGGVYCRGSSQMKQVRMSLGLLVGNCVPQATQTRFASVALGSYGGDDMMVVDGWMDGGFVWSLFSGSLVLRMVRGGQVAMKTGVIRIRS